MSGANFGSNAEATDQRIAGTDQSQIAVRRGIIVNPGGVAFGAKSGNTTYKIGKGGTVTLNSGLQGEEVAGLLDRVTQASATQIAAYKDSFDAQQSAIAKLSASAQQTDDEKKNKSVLWIALAALGLVALWVLND